MNTDFKFYDDPYEIFSRAFHKDKNFTAENQLFYFTKENYKYINIPSNTSLNPQTIESYIALNNLNELNKIFHYPNKYGLWSDIIKDHDKSKIQNFFIENKEDTYRQVIVNQNLNQEKQKSSTFLMKKSSAKDKNLKQNKIENKVIVMGSLCTKKNGYIPNVSKLAIKKEVLNDFDKIRNLDHAFKFLEKYGTDYPISEYSFYRFTVNVVEVSSVEIRDKQLLIDIGKEALKNKLHISDDNYEITKELEVKNDLKYSYKLRFYKTLVLPSFFRANISNSEYIEWKPIWKILQQEFDKYEIDLKYLIYVKHAWFFRNSNYELMKINFSYFVNNIKENELIDNIENFIEKYRSFEMYWFEVLYNEVKLRFIKKIIWQHYNKAKLEFIIDKDVQNLVINCFEQELSLFSSKIESLVKMNVFHLNKDSDLDHFILKKIDNFKIFAFYYNKNLIVKNMNIWSNLYKNFLSALDANDDMKSIGILINYDLHPEIEYRIMSFKKSFHIENIFQIEKNENSSILDYHNQNRIAFNDIELNWNKRKLDLSENSFVLLTKFQFNFSFYSYYLKELYLRQSAIFFIEENTFDNFLKLEVLDLSDNCLRNINEMYFKKLSNLKFLNLSECRIQSINSKSFKNLINLKVLDLSQNKLKFNDDISYFDNLKSLEFLNLNLNEIENFKNNEIFSNLTNLKKLYVSWNKLVKIEKSLLSGLNKIETIDFSNNLIEQINPESFFYLTNLKILCLNNNNIHSLNANLFKYLENLKMLFLHGNQFKDLSENLFSSLYNIEVLSLFNDVNDKSKLFKNLLSDVQKLRLRYYIYSYNIDKIKNFTKANQSNFLLKNIFNNFI